MDICKLGVRDAIELDAQNMIDLLWGHAIKVKDYRISVKDDIKTINILDGFIKGNYERFTDTNRNEDA